MIQNISHLDRIEISVVLSWGCLDVGVTIGHVVLLWFRLLKKEK